jgi:lipopolysaccharide export system permease protein
MNAKPVAKSGLRFGFGPVLDRFLLAEIVPQVLLYLTIVGGMFLLFEATVVTKYFTSGVSIWTVIEVLLLNLPPCIVISFPMAMLLGSILGFTKISADSEAVALLAAGVSFRRMIWPAAIAGITLMIVGLVINNTLVPYSANRLADIQENVLKETVNSSQPFALPPIRTNIKNQQRLQATVWVEGGYDSASKAMKRVYITQVDPVSNVPVMEIYARTANWLGGESWILRDVDVLKAGTVAHLDTLNTHEIHEAPSALQYFDRSPDSLNFRQLRQRIKILKENGAGNIPDVRDAEVNLWNKICLPVACLVFAIVGSALGFRPQRSASRGLAHGQGVLVIFSYYALFKVMEAVATNGQADPFLAASLPVFCAAILGWFLVARTTT